MAEKHEKNTLSESEAIDRFIASQQIPIGNQSDALAAEWFYKTGIHVSGIDGVGTMTSPRTSPSSAFPRR